LPPGKGAIPAGENRRTDGVWNYGAIDHLNTDQMFAGRLVYRILSADAAALVPHLFKGFDDAFAEQARPGDTILAGENFGCGSAREHPAVGLAHLGIEAVIVKSVNRIFYRAALNQGLPLIVHRQAVEAYRPGDRVTVDLRQGRLTVGGEGFSLPPLPDALLGIIEKKGLVHWVRETAPRG
jgi:3-isopropylmalate dehydratase small subunit